MLINLLLSALLKLDIILQNSVGLYIIVVFSVRLVVCHKKCQEEYVPIAVPEAMASELLTIISHPQQTSVINQDILPT
jgi:hypothetical protein